LTTKRNTLICQTCCDAPLSTHGKIHDITPQSAGWHYVGFSLFRLRAGNLAGEETGDNEVILVVVEGNAQITWAGHFWGLNECFRKDPATLPLSPQRL
jgi:5-deoxy-D-glucuronate isomerase